jgi:hypothetical protein
VETLHTILSDRGVESIITWLPSGKAFAILDRLEYRRLFLRNTQFDSFLRRLKRWGFKKVHTTGTVYFHELFQKDRPDLLEKMKMKMQVVVNIMKNSTKVARLLYTGSKAVMLSLSAGVTWMSRSGLISALLP